jgi:RNA polymerase sigma-70 factor (ECF subfamily)
VKFLKVFSKTQKDPHTEPELLAAYRQTGDLRLLGTLYGTYMEMVFGICYKYLKDENRAKDAVMQLFEKIIVDLKTHEVVNFKSWLHTVARNHCLMQLRSGRIFVSMDESEEEGEISLVEEVSETEDMFSEKQMNSMHSCLEALTMEQKWTVRLFYFQEKCYKEIARETGFDMNKVKSYIQNGKRNLKICMERNGRL